MSPTDDESLRAMLRFGLARAIQLHSEEVRARFPQLSLDLDLVDDENLLDDFASHALFRIYLEVIHNVEHHLGDAAGAGSARQLSVRNYLSGPALVLEIRDDGSSFSIPHDWARFAQGAGVMGMKSQIAGLGGSLKVTAEPGPGVLIQASVPIQ